MTRFDGIPFDGQPDARSAAAAGCGPDPEAARGPLAALAGLVLALATGLPLRSVGRLMPEAGEQAGPFLGI